MKIAVMGGAFNPIHIGHIRLADGFSRHIGADKLLLIPTGHSPHKSNAALIDSAHRVNMCRLCLPEIYHSEICDIELKRGGASYTVDTLRELKNIYPGAELYLICGSDMFLTLDRWRNPRGIFSLSTICAAKRNDETDSAMLSKKAQLENMGARVELLDIKIPPFSSTEIRKRAAGGMPIDNMVLPAVGEYIAKNRLYLKD